MACGPSATGGAVQQCGTTAAYPRTMLLSESGKKRHPQRVGLMEGTPVSSAVYDNMDANKANEFATVHNQMMPDQETGQKFIRDKDIKGFAMEDNVTPEDISEATDNQVMFRQFKNDGLGRRPAEFLLRPPPDVPLDLDGSTNVPQWGLTDRFVRRANELDSSFQW